MQGNISSRKPRILLAVCGTEAAMKFEILCRGFSEWAEVRAVGTRSSLYFIKLTEIRKNAKFYLDEDEWRSWSRIGDSVLHIELGRWADCMVIAPLSANTLGKLARGLCDNLLTCIVRAWDYSKPLFVAPDMNTLMWNNSLTEQQFMKLDELGVELIPPTTQRLASGDYGKGAMAEPYSIYAIVRPCMEMRMQLVCSQNQRVQVQSKAISLKKPRILLAASGCVAAMQFGNLCLGFLKWAEVRAVGTRSSLYFIDMETIRNKVIFYSDEDEWRSWRNKIGDRDSVLHIELGRWADIMIIAPLSANTFAKVAMGFCDNLVTCIVRSWDCRKPLIMAPDMDTLMWDSCLTEENLKKVDGLGVGVTVIPPGPRRLANGEYGHGVMADPTNIYLTVRHFLEGKKQLGKRKMAG